MDTSGSVWATILGFATITVGATTVFAQFQKSLNKTLEVKVKATKREMAFYKNQIIIIWAYFNHWLSAINFVALIIRNWSS